MRCRRMRLVDWAPCRRSERRSFLVAAVRSGSSDSQGVPSIDRHDRFGSWLCKKTSFPRRSGRVRSASNFRRIAASTLCRPPLRASSYSAIAIPVPCVARRTSRPRPGAASSTGVTGSDANQSARNEGDGLSLEVLPSPMQWRPLHLG